MIDWNNIPFSDLRTLANHRKDAAVAAEQTWKAARAGDERAQLEATAQKRVAAYQEAWRAWCARIDGWKPPT